MHKTFLVILLLTTSAIFSSCDNGGDLAEKKKLLAEHKKELKELRTKIRELEDEIAEADTSDHQIPPKKITTRPVEVKTFKHFIEIQGTATSDENISVSSEIGGAVMQIFVKEGQVVSQGSLLLKTDDKTIIAAIAEINTGLALARDLYHRQENLWKQEIGSEVQYLQAKNQVETLEKQLASAQAQLDKTNIKSPISGTVDEIFVNLGEMAAPGRPVVRVVNLSEIQVIADASEKHVADISKGDPVILSFPSLDHNLETKISAVGQVVNPKNRTFKVEVNAPNGDGKIKTNMLATIKIVDYQKDSAVVAPTRLVQQSHDEEYIFILHPNKKTAIKKVIETGESYNGESEILSGLNGKEILVDAGFREVMDNGSVEVVE